MRQSHILILFSVGVLRISAQDAELTNHKCGIDVVWGGSKGSAYQEEYYFHDKLLFDQKQVWIRDDTSITMRHNANNCKVTSASGRNRVVVGANGPDGISNSGDEGKIRFVVDEIWRVKNWTPGFNGKNPVYSAYANPFALASLSFDTGHPVVGTTGAHPTIPVTDDGNFYWRGMLDSVGDEWHVLRYGDDDQTTGSNYDDAWASDGKYVLLCVNPKTPALTTRASGDGEFYTTPAWTYWTHKIHDQTTYLRVGSGSVTFELRNIYDGGISYRINNGPSVNVGLASVTVLASQFNNGTNSLEYWYTATPAKKRTRTIVKNPAHPGTGEGHGNRLWSDANWTAFQSRITRAPYNSLLTAMQNRNGGLNRNDQANWDTRKRLGLRLGATSTWPFKAGQAATNAIAAKYFGWSAAATGASQSYAAYAKEMLMESSLNNSYVGIEMPYWASQAQPCIDTVYRGYWDVDAAYSAAIAYDVLMGGYRSDQQPGGITPIEDYFLRDRLAEWVHHCQIPYGGELAGMWSMSRNVGAAVIAAIMPSYSTPYYGTSGVDGTTTSYPWAPFRSKNLTWKTTFMTHNYTPGTYPETQWAPYEFTEGMTNIHQAHLIGPLTLPAEEGHVRIWRLRHPYTSWTQCGHNIAMYALLWKMYFPNENRPDLLTFINQITAGTLYGARWIGDSERDDPTRQPFLWCLNGFFPESVANARAWVQSLPASDGNSEAAALGDGGILSVFYYDDGRISSPDLSSSQQTSSPSSNASSSAGSGSSGGISPAPAAKSGGGGAPSILFIASIAALALIRHTVLRAARPKASS